MRTCCVLRPTTSFSILHHTFLLQISQNWTITLLHMIMTVFQKTMDLFQKIVCYFYESNRSFYIWRAAVQKLLFRGFTKVFGWSYDYPHTHHIFLYQRLLWLPSFKYKTDEHQQIRIFWIIVVKFMKERWVVEKEPARAAAVTTWLKIL